MAVKQIKVQVDLNELNKQLETKREQDLLDPSEIGAVVRTTVFSLGTDPRLATDPVIKPPVLRYIEILRDGLNNPFVRIHWRMKRQDVESGNIKYFNVFKQKIRPFKKVRAFHRVAYDKIGQGITRRGRFSSEKKALTMSDSSIISDPRS